MTLQEFIEQHNGKYLEVAGSSAVNQCVDLANGYIRDVLGLPIIEWTNAMDFPSKANGNYDWIANTPDGVPQEGDLVIWGGNQYGHIGVFVEGNANSFRSFDQNYPTGSPCHIQNHSYVNVNGWMKPKKKANTVSVDSNTFQQLVDKSTKYDSFNAAGYITVDDVVKKVGDLNNEKNGIQNQLNEELQKNQDLRDVLDKQTKADADLGTQLLDAQHKADELTKELEQVKAEKAQPAEQAKDEAIKYYEPKIEELLKNIGRNKKAKSFIDKLWGWLS